MAKSIHSNWHLTFIGYQSKRNLLFCTGLSKSIVLLRVLRQTWRMFFSLHRSNKSHHFSSLFIKRITNVSFRMALSFWKLVLLNADAKSTLQLIWLVVNHPQNLDWKFIDNFYVITRWTPGPSPGSIKESPGTICWIDWCVFEENICWF